MLPFLAFSHYPTGHKLCRSQSPSLHYTCAPNSRMYWSPDPFPFRLLLNEAGSEVVRLLRRKTHKHPLPTGPTRSETPYNVSAGEVRSLMKKYWNQTTLKWSKCSGGDGTDDSICLEDLMCGHCRICTSWIKGPGPLGISSNAVSCQVSAILI